MGGVLTHPVTTKLIERQADSRFRMGVCSMGGYREGFEDAHAVHLYGVPLPCCGTPWGFFGVFDGHSGAGCAKKISQKLPFAVGQADIPMSDGQLEEICLRVDAEYLKQLTPRPAFIERANPAPGSTATMAIVHVKGGVYHVHVGNVGDSRVLCCSGGEFIPLTEDHKPTNKTERKRIERAGGTVSNQRVDGDLAVSRSFGDGRHKRGGQDNPRKHRVTAQPDSTRRECHRGDFLVLACDGIFESMSNEEVLTRARDALQEDPQCDLGYLSGRICDEALTRGSTDNMTCMVVQFESGPSGKPEEVIPGPYYAAWSDTFRKLYAQMAQEGGITEDACVERRHDLVVAELQRRTAETGATLNGCDLETLSQSEMLQLLQSLNAEHKRTWTRERCLEALSRLAEEGARVVPCDVVDLRTELSHWTGDPTYEEVGRLSGARRTQWFREWMLRQRKRAPPPGAAHAQQTMPRPPLVRGIYVDPKEILHAGENERPKPRVSNPLEPRIHPEPPKGGETPQAAPAPATADAPPAAPVAPSEMFVDGGGNESSAPPAAGAPPSDTADLPEVREVTK